MQTGRQGLLLLAMLSPSSVRAQRAPDPERDAVRQVITSLAEYIQAGDMASIEPLFRARGVHILTDSATTHGWTEYRDEHLQPDLKQYTDLRYTHTAVEPVVRGNVAWVAFRRELSVTGSTTPFSGRGTAVLEKIDGRWVIVHLHMSR